MHIYFSKATSFFVVFFYLFIVEN